MSGIVVFGGTSEGRQIAEAFQNTKLIVHLCVATDYGATLLPDCPNILIHAGRMDRREMEAFFEELNPEYCLDATHPYASAVTENIKQACHSQNLPYIRVLRREESLESLEGQTNNVLHYCESAEEAASFLNETTGKILITTGSKDLEKYTRITGYKDRCIARVLPTAPVMEKCRELGFEGRNLIGMQGPFSEELNNAMLKQVNASWLVTKSSGKEGGCLEKCKAALHAGVNILMIGRPAESAAALHPKEEDCITQGQDTMELPDAIHFLDEHYRLIRKRSICLIAMGPGSPALLTKEAEEYLRNSDVILGAGRILKIWPEYANKPFFESYRKEEIASFLHGNPQYQKAAVVYSGDIGFYSGAKGMQEYFPESEYEIHPVSGVASPVYFLNRLGIPWNDVWMASCHGQSCDLIPLIKHHKKVCVLLGDTGTIAKTCRTLLDFHMDTVKITIGERLSYSDEQMITGYPHDLVSQKCNPLSIALFENPNAQAKKASPGIDDTAFLRTNVPMTKQDIRILSLAKLQLTQDSVLYDIGAGTGSISIEAALQCEKGTVFAIEKNPKAACLIDQNRNRFQTENLRIITGEAPECFKELPVPTHAFIGGSTGKILDIIQSVRIKNPKVRFVLNAVTIETLAQIPHIIEIFPEYRNMEILQVSISKSRTLGSYHLMSAENPIYIISFG